MRLQRTRPAMLLAVLAATATPCLAQPELEIPDPALAGELTNRHKAEIREYIVYWRDRMVEADSAEEVASAHQALRDSFRKYGSASYRRAYARIAGEEMMKLINQPRETLTRLREVNAAMVLARIHHVAASDAYRDMLSHGSDAVRYYGWRACAWVAMGVLARGSDGAEAFLNDVRRAAIGEDSAIVAEQMFAALAAPPAPVADIPAGKQLQMRAELLAVMEQPWLHWSRRVLEADADAADACRVGVAQLSAALPRFDDEQHKPTRILILQMIADALWAASRSYRQMGATGPAAAAAEQLLIDLEQALNAAQGTDRSLIRGPLGARELAPGRRADRVRTGALEWINLHLRDEGVVDPKPRLIPPTTRPSESAGAGTGD